MSLGSVGHPSAYQFTQDFSILSQDGNCNTESNANCMAKSGTTLTGEEGAGTIEFFGTYSSISWTVTVPEYYSGFNIGVTSVAANHTVTFDANGGSGSMTDQAGKVSAALTANSFTRTGYNFAGWNSAAPGGGNAYADGASYAFTADVILYAQWTANPTITMGDTMSYRIGSGAKVIDQGTPATVTDTNVSNFNTGKLTVTVSGATGNDVLGILTGTGTGTFSVSSNIVTYDTGSGPLVIGTISGGTNGNPLEVTFTSSNATPPRVSALLNSITYANASLTNVTQRTVSFTVKDSGGTSAPSAVTITLTRPGFHQLWG